MTPRHPCSHPRIQPPLWSIRSNFHFATLELQTTASAAALIQGSLSRALAAHKLRIPARRWKALGLPQSQTTFMFFCEMRIMGEFWNCHSRFTVQALFSRSFLLIDQTDRCYRKPSNTKRVWRTPPSVGKSVLYPNHRSQYYVDKRNGSMILS